MAVIDVRNVRKTYVKNLTRKINAVQDITFSVTEGRVVGFIGPNGAGKSTTIKMLLGLIRPEGGDVRLFGGCPGDASIRHRVGYLPENPAFYDFLNAHEILRFVGGTFGMTDAALTAAVEEVLHKVDLVDAAKRPIRTFSKGMVQRLALAQTLLHDPELYVLDEPMSGLDPVGRRLVADIILDLKRRGRTVFFSTHIIQDIESICDEVVVVNEGVVRFTGDIKTVIDESFRRYEVSIRGHAAEDLPAHVPVTVEEGIMTFLVAREDIGQMLPRLVAFGEIIAIEPERQTLEEIFLQLVRYKDGCSQS